MTDQERIAQLERQLARAKVKAEDLEISVAHSRSPYYEALSYIRKHEYKNAEDLIAHSLSVNPSNWFGEQIANATFPLIKRAEQAEFRCKELEGALEDVMAFWGSHEAWGDFATPNSAAASFAKVADRCRIALASIPHHAAEEKKR